MGTMHRSNYTLAEGVASQIENINKKFENDPRLLRGLWNSAMAGLISSVSVAGVMSIMEVREETDGLNDCQIEACAYAADLNYDDLDAKPVLISEESIPEPYLLFPLITSETDIQYGQEGLIWCYDSLENCHHNYNATDIFVPPGTQVIAATPGYVVKSFNQAGGVGSRITIKGEDGNIYYYAHMAEGSVIHAEGDFVNTGEIIGLVGEREQAANTPPHLHFDILPPEYGERIDCRGPQCNDHPFIDSQALLYQSFQYYYGNDR